MTHLDVAKRIHQSENGHIVKSGFEERLHTFLLSVATAGTIGCFGFLWSMNNSITRLQEHDTETIKSRAEQSIRTNAMQLDIRDIRERVIKIESQNSRQ